jgi:hypothetical protein
MLAENEKRAYGGDAGSGVYQEFLANRPLILVSLLQKQSCERRNAMLTQAFYYFLLVGELAILGLLIMGIYQKATKIIELYSIPADDQDTEHNVSASDHIPGILVEVSAGSHTERYPGQACEVRPNRISSITRH